MAAAKPKYRVLVGMDYSDHRAEAGDVVTDIPSVSIPWLLEQGCIELATDKPKAGE